MDGKNINAKIVTRFDSVLIFWLVAARECSTCCKNDTDTDIEDNDKVDLEAPRKLRETKRDEKKVFNLISKYSNKVTSLEYDEHELNREEKPKTKIKKKKKDRLNKTVADPPMASESIPKKSKAGRKRKVLSQSLPLDESVALSSSAWTKRLKPDDVPGNMDQHDTISITHTCCICTETLNMNEKRKNHTRCMTCSKWYHYSKLIQPCFDGFRFFTTNKKLL
jgi:hypothetical protein